MKLMQLRFQRRISKVIHYVHFTLLYQVLYSNCGSINIPFSQLRTGFSKAELFPLSDPEQIICSITTAPSVPFAMDTQTRTGNQSVCLNVCCTKFGGALTPVRLLHLALYFSKELQYKPVLKKAKV